MIRTLTFTTLFPNGVQPVKGIFVANRLSHLLATGEVATQIVAPVPWFPFTAARFGSYAKLAAVPATERRLDSPVLHPRYALIPKVSMALAPALLYAGARRTVAAIRRGGFDFDLIDAHYFYPDGVAAILLGKEFNKPVVITARGSDVNQIGDFRLPRQMIRWAAREAAGVITVCQALKDRLCEIGASPDKIHVLRNGVDLALFRPRHRDSLRAAHGLSGKVVLSVGYLIERKGHHLAIRAIAEMPDVTLLIAGTGPDRDALAALAASLGIAGRVRLLGEVAPALLAEIYAAADLLVLASASEGWANVLLEAMACGTPVVASDVGGSPEVVTERAAGLLVENRSVAELAAAIADLLTNPPDRAATRAYAERFSWDDTTAGQLALFRSILSPPAGILVGGAAKG